MSVIAFPCPVLTKDDETTIIRTIFSGGYYSCQRAISGEGQPCITLFNRERQVRGHVTKKHGVYAITDSRGTVVRQSRKLGDVLSILTD